MRGKQLLVAATLVAGVAIARPVGADAPPGSLDRHYGKDGVVASSGIVRGWSFGRTGDALVIGLDSLQRVTPDGRLDDDYGIDGTAALPGLPISDLHPVRLRDGGVLIAGASRGAFPPQAIVVTKVLPDGRPDLSFGGDGSIDYPPSNFAFNEIRTAAVADDGHVFVGGNTDRGPATLRRIERNGDLVSTQCGAVPAVQTFPRDRIEASATRGGVVLVAGTGIDPVTSQRGTRVRLVDNCGRTLRSGLIPDPPGRFFSAQSAVATADGWLLRSSEALLKVRADGTADTRFGGDGYLMFDDLGGLVGNMQSAVEDDDRRLVLSGSSGFVAGATPLTIRLRADATVDPTYGTGGSAPVVGLPPDVTGAGPVAITPDGGILVATAWFLPDVTMASSISRYLG